MITATDRSQVAAIGPGLVLEFEDTSHVASQAFLVGDLLVVFPVDTDGRVQGFKVSEVSPDRGGYTFDAPGALHLAVFPLPDSIDPKLRVLAGSSGGHTQESAEAFVGEVP